MSALLAFITTPQFLTGSFVSGLLGSGGTYISTRNSDTRKMVHDELMNKRKLAYEAATAFSEVCSGVIEKSMDIKGVFNALLDYARTRQGLPDAKAREKIEYAVDLSNQMKRVTTAFNNLRMVAPVPVLDKANALLAAIMALTKATTQPLAKPPLLAQAGKAFEDFTNAIRAESGLDAYTKEDASRAQMSYMETLQKQVQDYIAEAREEFRRRGFPEPKAS
jgi:hypothetical protein